MDSGLIKSKIKARTNSQNLNIMNILYVYQNTYISRHFFSFSCITKGVANFPVTLPVEARARLRAECNTV